MAEHVDFEKLKREISLKRVLAHYSLLNQMKRASMASKALRGPCPFCKASRSFYAYQGDMFHCHNCKANGSVIDLVARVEKCSVRDAGLKLKHMFDTQPENQKGDERIIDLGHLNPALLLHAGEAPWKADLKLLWDLFDELDVEGKYYDALGRLEDLVTTFGPWYEDEEPEPAH